MNPSPFITTFPAVAPSPAENPAVPKIAGYEDLLLIGRGGMGKVYRAKHSSLGRTVALKVLAHEPEERLLARFAEEARAVARLNHPNICPLFETGTVEGRPYFAQEYLEGGTLAQKFNGAPQDPRDAVGIVETISNAIQYSHDHGILHRDLKPGNILLAADGTLKVTDFGLAKELAPSDGMPRESAALTRTGEIVGTPAYMSPEQASGVVSGLGATTDVYALGAILYEALTGRPPFQAPDALQTLLMVLAMDPVSPRTLQPKVPRDLETICLKCLEKSPKRRYPTARELAEDLHRFHEGRPILARPVGFVERTSKWAKRNKAQAGLVALSFAMVLAMIGFAILQTIGAAREREINRDLATAKKNLEDSNTDLEKSKRELEGTNADLLAAKAESDKSYALAVEALQGILERFSNSLFGIPLLEGVMLAATGDAVTLYQKLAELRPNDRPFSSQYVLALIDKASQERSYSKLDAAAKTLDRADAYLRQRLDEAPGDRPLLFGRVRLDLERVNASEARGPSADLDKLRRELIGAIDDFCRRYPDDPSCANFTVNRYRTEAALAGDTDQYKAKLEAHVKATAAARAFYKAHPANPSAFILLHSSLYLLGATHEMRRELAEAFQFYAESEKLLAPALVANPNQPTLKGELASAKEAMARAAAKLGDFSGSAKLYGEAEPLQRELILLFPLDPYQKYNLANNLVDQADLERSVDLPAAKKKLDEALVLSGKLAKEFPKNETFTVQDAKWRTLRQKLDGGK